MEYNLKYARYTVENRELLRYERTRVFGKIRELFLRIGLILTSMDVLEEKKRCFIFRSRRSIRLYCRKIND